MQDIINNLIPGDISITVDSDETEIDRAQVAGLFEEAAAEDSLEISQVESCRYLSFVAGKEGNRYVMNANNAETDEGNLFVIVSAEEYTHLTGKNLRLEKNQVAALSEGEDLPERFKLGNMDFEVKVKPGSFFPDAGEMNYMRSAYDVSLYYLVVADDQILEQLYQTQKQEYGEMASNIRTLFAADLSGSEQQKMDCAYYVFEKMADAQIGGPQASIGVQSRQQTEYQYRGLTGGFLFLGIFLGVVFTFAAALIIYYKQISEGYYDRSKFDIMQKSRHEQGRR